MKISEMFEHDIHRSITGVVKVEQTKAEEVFQEIFEFVVTKELRGHFNDFYKSYNNSLGSKTDDMGVWLSGFFGSGKSHFLKMLSYLLENKVIKETKTIEFFKEKLNNDDPLLFNEMKRAATWGTTDSLLFNIESKSSSQDRTSKTAIVDIFMKVFNEHLGYCGDIPWLADIERTLDEEGKYEKLKEVYKEITNEDWEEARHKIYFIRDAFIDAITKTRPETTSESASALFDNAEKNYKLTPEKFALLIKKYIDKKGKNHRIIFLVDEMGQYIGDNSQLMLNLQTVTENLGTYCQGRAWVIVTSQEAIDNLTKNRLSDQDFSKIQGRFATRLNLSSSNTDEVIKKRLLSKKEHARETLVLTYKEHCASLKNLISFSPNTAGMKSFQSDVDFSETYPFTPYQFNLLQKVFENIRKHSHAGKHLAEGERSMLNAFHSAVKNYSEKEINIIIPFYTFYGTMESFLDSSVKRIFDKAKENSNLEPFDIEVLKVLFMIKYIKEMPADIENIATLMISKLDEDKINLRNSIDASLARLKAQALISQNGSLYDFLTDEEQDVERGIRAVKLDFTNDVIDSLARRIFDDILNQQKSFNYSKFNTYNFSRILDKKMFSKQGDDIALMVLTPENDEFLNELAVKNKSMDEGLLIVKLPNERRYIDELELILKTERYLKEKSDTKITESVKRIISIKREELETRKKRLSELISYAIINASFYTAGDILAVEGNTAKTKIENALKNVVVNTYHKLPFIDKNIKDEHEIQMILTGSVQITFNQENIKAIEDMRVFITQKDQFHMRTTMRDLKERYSKKPYGWNLLDISGITAILFSKKEIKLEYNGEPLLPSDKNILSYLTKEKEFDRLVITLKKKVDESLIETGKEIGKLLFGCYDLSNEGDDLVSKLRDICIFKEMETLSKLLVHYDHNNKYPGKDIIKNGVSLLKEFNTIKDTASFLETLEKRRDELKKWKSDAEPVKEFFSGTQKRIFEKALVCIDKFNEHGLFIGGDDIIIRSVRELEKIVNHPSPYRSIIEVPGFENNFSERYSALLKEEKDRVKGQVEEDISIIQEEMYKNGELDTKFKEEILSPFTEIQNKIDKASDFNVLIYKEKSQKCRDEGLEKIRKSIKTTPNNIDNIVLQKKPVGIDTLPVDCKIKTIETKEDVKLYINALEQTLCNALEENKIIVLEK